MSYVEGLLSSNQKDVLMEEIVANYHANTKDAEVVLVEGLVPTRKHQFAQSLNYEIAKTLNAEIVFVMSQGTDTPGTAERAYRTDPQQLRRCQKTPTSPALSLTN